MVKAKEWYANDGGVLMRKVNKKKKRKKNGKGVLRIEILERFFFFCYEKN